jgi:bifunctional DNase/RNase
VLRRDGELIEVDSRPSDAIAVGAGTSIPILVDESVLQEVC